MNEKMKWWRQAYGKAFLVGLAVVISFLATVILLMIIFSAL